MENLIRKTEITRLFEHGKRETRDMLIDLEKRWLDDNANARLVIQEYCRKVEEYKKEVGGLRAENEKLKRRHTEIDEITEHQLELKRQLSELEKTKRQKITELKEDVIESPDPSDIVNLMASPEPLDFPNSPEPVLPLNNRMRLNIQPLSRTNPIPKENLEIQLESGVVVILEPRLNACRKRMENNDMPWYIATAKANYGGLYQADGKFVIGEQYVVLDLVLQEEQTSDGWRLATPLTQFDVNAGKPCENAPEVFINLRMFTPSQRGSDPDPYWDFVVGCKKHTTSNDSTGSGSESEYIPQAPEVN